MLARIHCRTVHSERALKRYAMLEATALVENCWLTVEAIAASLLARDLLMDLSDLAGGEVAGNVEMIFDGGFVVGDGIWEDWKRSISHRYTLDIEEATRRGLTVSRRLTVSGTTRFCLDVAENAPCPDGYQCDEVQEGTTVCVAIPPPPEEDGDGDGGDEDGEDGGCTVSSGADPTNPVPWFLGMGALAWLAARRRRSR